VNKKLIMAEYPSAGRNKGKVEIRKMWRLPKDTHFMNTTLVDLTKEEPHPVCGLADELCAND